MIRRLTIHDFVMTMSGMVAKPKDVKVEVRAAADDVDQWRAAAEAQDMSLSDWIRRACRAAVPQDKPTKKGRR